MVFFGFALWVAVVWFALVVLYSYRFVWVLVTCAVVCGLRVCTCMGLVLLWVAFDLWFWFVLHWFTCGCVRFVIACCCVMVQLIVL